MNRLKTIGAITFLVLLLTTSPVYATQQPGAETQKLAAPLDTSKIVFQEVAGGYNDPVFITNAGDGSGRLFIVERAGVIRIIKNGVPLATPFLNIQSSVKSTAGEQGLLALAFHPSYSTNGIFFVVYTSTRSGDSEGSNLTLKKFSVSANPNIADVNTGSIVMRIPHPGNSNHNGGGLAFGQDGYLYWSTGDGGGGGDPDNNAQNLNKWLGKMLRIDVDSASPYAIPSSNPFFSNPSTTIKKEIWAYGLRNPWHFSFDSLTYDLYIGDVGQGTQEEIDFQPSTSPGGENYGWRVMEGILCYDPSSGCDQSGKTLPVAYYDHDQGCSVTGGYVYRGTTFTPLYGHYFFADFCSGNLFNLFRNSTPGWDPVQMTETPYRITTFGEDEERELYIADYSDGTIYRIGYQTNPPATVTLKSNGANDGWVLESTPTSNQGGTLNATAPVINIGDNGANRQYRGILDFDTSVLPDNAVVTGATIRIRKQGFTGTNPFNTHGSLRADIRLPYFGSGISLEIGDFQASASQSSTSIFNSTPINNWYSSTLSYPGTIRINSSGSTQFRLRFTAGDNADNNADMLKFFSGNANDPNRPQLILEYYVP
jgi:glucose/arabinose dehydrogenase